MVSPKYDFVTCVSDPDGEVKTPAKVVLTEGLYVLNEEVRDKRSKGQVKSALDSIPGIGPKSRDLLLSHFKSVKRIKEASESDLMAVVGTAKAKIIKKYLI